MELEIMMSSKINHTQKDNYYVCFHVYYLHFKNVCLCVLFIFLSVCVPLFVCVCVVLSHCCGFLFILLWFVCLLLFASLFSKTRNKDSMALDGRREERGNNDQIYEFSFFPL